MKVIEYFDSDQKEAWLEKIGRSDWGAGKNLHALLKDAAFQNQAGDLAKVYLLVDETGDLLSFCTFTSRDDIPNTSLGPWIGYVYTFPQHRGHGYCGTLLAAVYEKAKEAGISDIFISTNEVGLYEKYGYHFLTTMKDIHQSDSRVYTIKVE